MYRTLTQISIANEPQEPVPALHACRQSVDSDLSHVESLRTSLTKVMFGEVDVRRCIEKFVCKTLVNVDDEVVAFLVVMDHPNIPALTNCSWISWIRRLYRIDFASPWNTLFVHYVVWDSRYPSFFMSFLKSFYKNNPKLEQILMVTPPQTNMFPELESVFTLVNPSGEGVAVSTFAHFQNLHLNLRHRVQSKLTVRKAGEEDNIDVQPLVHHQFDVLKYVFGDFRLGNVIDLKTPSKAILVAEKGSSVTVGVLSLSSKVDYKYANFFYHHVLDTDRRDSIMDPRITRTETIMTDTFSEEDDQLSIELNMEKYASVEEEESDEGDEDRDELVVYWDVDGDMFRVLDPVMEYLLHSKRGTQGTELQAKESEYKKSTSHKSLEYTYWGRPSWSMSLMPLATKASSGTRERMGTLGNNQYMNSTYTPHHESAFIITLFALHPDLDVRYAFDMLEASFECFTDKHFCLLYLPTAYQGSPLTQHMVRMSPKMSRDFPNELYITHRNATFSVFTVRPVNLVDHVGIHELVENISQSKKITKDINNIFLQESPETRGFILECEGNIVGVAVISDNFGLHQLQPHYMIEELIQLGLYNQENHGLIRHLVLCPIFLKSGPFFLRQIMHQAGLETLSYTLLHNDIINLMNIGISPITVLNDMTPVKPRDRIIYDLSGLDDFTPEDHVLHLEHNFALFIATEKLLSIPIVELNYRIVVVGGSDTAMSFLENLIFGSAEKHIRYNNLMLVSIHGFPLELRPHVSGDKMVPHRGVYTREYLSRISLSTHVNVLYGALTIINRKEKMICLNEDHWLRYDYLFLMTGMQICKPWPAEDSPSMKHASTGHTMSGQTESDSYIKDDRDYPKQDCHKNEDIRELFNCISQQYGENMFVINTSADAVIALGQLKKSFKHKQEGKILVYGHSLNLYSCVESLLVFGVPGHKIALVISPHSTLSHRCLEANPFVEKVILQTMEEAGVTIYKGFSIICWSLKHKSIDTVMFRNNENLPLTLDCIALFSFGPRSTNAKTYMAVSDAGIVYNNGIIIDNQFRTNDEYIYAAGPGTRYSNRYSPTQFVHHKYYNSVEVGLHMSNVFRRLVEPLTEGCIQRSQAPDITSQLLREKVDPPYSETTVATPPTDLIPELQEPITWVAELPGGWKYVKVSRPGRPIPLECQFNGQGDSGPILITGVPILPDGPGYFQLSFSIYNTVHEVVLLSKKEIPYNNLRKLYGKHERMLNNLYDHYNQGLISDFYAFFSEPWAYAIYSMRFNELVQQCAEMFVASEGGDLQHVHDLESQRLDATLGILSTEHETISCRYQASSIPMYVEHLTLKYITERPLQLPMYFTDSGLSSWYQSSYANSPLHRDTAKVRRKTKASQSVTLESQSP